MEHSMTWRRATTHLWKFVAGGLILTSGHRSKHSEPRRKPEFRELDKSGMEMLKTRRWL